ncbi:MAG: methylated-DNA--[protein]-cysteine S-methyltransferase [Deltaproteobacteria bacterium]|nr:methylated-DNA--[protein]-cysteine S-methyltransferase [Deltaproteobacteria bacterium]
MTAKGELDAYFTGQLCRFSTPCDLRGLPPFTQAVLNIASKIPYGEVRSYRWVAEQLGSPKAARAVGNALARNPIPIIIPCHRVVRTDGSLGGYALGLDWKRRLLELERSHCRVRGAATGWKNPPLGRQQFRCRGHGGAVAAGRRRGGGRQPAALQSAPPRHRCTSRQGVDPPRSDDPRARRTPSRRTAARARWSSPIPPLPTRRCCDRRTQRPLVATGSVQS